MRIIDLTLPIDGDMRGVNISPARTIAENGWNATTLEMYSHSGTHMDAPVHFIDGEATIDQQNLSECIGPAIVLQLAPALPSQQFTIDDLRPYESDIRKGSRLLFRTDWHRQYGSDNYRDRLPRISNELASWLVEREVALIGVEPPSVADVNNISELTEVHQTLFRGGVTIVEGLANLDQLTQPIVWLMALPLAIRGGDGTPVRAIAIEGIDVTDRESEA